MIFIEKTLLITLLILQMTTGNVTAPHAFTETSLEMPKEVVREEQQKPTRELVDAVVTFYTISDDECGNSNGITASGTVATVGRTIAMSEKYPFGTKVVIDGATFIVEDRGGGITGNHIDILVSTKEEAMKRGRYVETVEIIKEEE